MATNTFSDSWGGFFGGLASTWGEVEKAKAQADAAKYTAKNSTTPGPEYVYDGMAVPQSQVQADAMRAQALRQTMPAMLWGVGALVAGVVVIKLMK